MAIISVLGSSIFLCIFLVISPPTLCISESEALLKLKKSFANSSSLDSWKPGTEPCAANAQWIGIICANGLVSSLRLKNLGLSGEIDVESLASLPGLRSVGFVSNSFTGPIPNFHRMVLLKGLYLSRNQFSGEIAADYFKPMAGLKKVWLSGNRFSGRIPASLFQLSHLMELRLDNNQFSGGLPLPELPALVFLDVSNNNLEGEIPPGLMRFGANTFKGNPGLCGSDEACDPSAMSTDPGMSSTHMSLFMWFMVAAALMFLVMVIGIFAMKRRQESGDDDIDECPSFHISSVRRTDGVVCRGEGIALGPPQCSVQSVSGRKGSRKYGKGMEIVMINDEKGEFTMQDLMKSTAEVLSNGASSCSYKAVMLTGMTVVVKRIKENAKIGKEQFDGEMRRLGCLKHENVSTPLAYHFRRDEKLLVSDYKPKGSLLYALHGDRGSSRSELDWSARLKIVQGIARGLAYLHAELSSLDLPHGNLKSSNVLLSQENEPLLTDYGLCLVISSCLAAQTLAAYKAPEAILDHHISPKCDVYCLGIIILEVLTGKFPCQFVNNGEGGVDTVQLARSAIADENEHDLFDPHMEQTDKSKHEMKQLLHIGVACTEIKPEQRLDMTEALTRIEGITVEGRSHDQTTIQVEALSRDGSFREVVLSRDGSFREV
ncbi:pollen receptor-like kinase 3 [Salvia miltiorrhiza]|uniref:pollen receptor-like kinase 3 n=1 Tax=Salvia miltiorrhiza TaxID=226208 RepID=UPI0025AC794E|nr:pollen receptor-like kinase 3 [Salvia miltiorrhiza]